MKLQELINSCNLEIIHANDLSVEIENGYIGDLLSDVMGHAPSASVWITVQSHMNIIAVASITGIRAIILCNGLEFEETTIEKAKQNNITLLSSNLASFKTSVCLFDAGLR